MEDNREEKVRGQSRRKQEGPKKKPVLPIAAAAAAVLILAAGGIGGFLYLREAKKYETVFFPNAVINGVDASGKTVDEIKEAIASGIDGYRLVITGRDGKTEEITKEEINLHSEFDGSLEKMLAEQNPKEWYKYTKEELSYEISTMIAYDEELLEKRLNELELLEEANMTAPVDAHISEYSSDANGYEIVPEVQGSTLKKDAVASAVTGAVKNLRTELDLEAEGCYEKPAVDAGDEGLLSVLNQLNKYTGAVVTHTFGDSKEVLDGRLIHQWLKVNGSEVTLDTSQVAAYVKELATKYNTAYKSKKLKTSYGQTVTITGGNYGWRISQDKETAAVSDIIRAGEQQTREPEYSQKAASHGTNDYGDTYVEMNLTSQHLFFYKNGKLLVESDFVSGNVSKGWGTPAGAFPLTYKERNATLTGEDYETPVSYWMPFNGGIGMHDANWRSTFGGSIYKTGGSHGCINLPPNVAKMIYENISAGMPVLCYNLEVSDSDSAGKPAESAPSETAPTETAPVETSPIETAPTTSASQGTEPAETQPESSTQGPSVPSETEPEETKPAETTAAAPPVETTPAPPEPPAEPGFAGPEEESQSTKAVGPGF